MKYAMNKFLLISLMILSSISWYNMVIGLWLYKSLLRGGMLAIFLLPQFKNRGRMTSDFDDLNTFLKIDLVLITEQIDPKLLANIEREGVFIYERSNAKSQ